MKTLANLFILSILLSACSKPEESEIDANKVIESVKSMSKLGTTEYTFSKVIAGQDNQWYTIGSRKFMMTCKAHVIAGIDASQIQFTDVKPKEKSIKLTIPAVELITFDIPPDEFIRTDLEIDPLRSNFTNSEWNSIQQKAEKMIKNDIKNYNIKAESEKNAILFLDRILRSSGFVSIEINTTPEIKL
jgi:hypothetical protein